VREGIDAGALEDARNTVDNLAGRQDPDSSGAPSSADTDTTTVGV
jgi:hypothetical protein